MATVDNDFPEGQHKDRVAWLHADVETRRGVDAHLAAADKAWSAASTAVEERWKERPERWLRFGMLLPLCGLVTTQVRRGLDGGLL